MPKPLRTTENQVKFERAFLRYLLILMCLPEFQFYSTLEMYSTLEFKKNKKICSVGQIDIIYQVSLKNERFLTTKWRKTKHLVCSLASPSTDCDNENLL